MNSYMVGVWQQDIFMDMESIKCCKYFCSLKQVPVKGAPVQSTPRSRQPIVHSGKLNFLKNQQFKEFFPFFQEFYIDHFMKTELCILNT